MNLIFAKSEKQVFFDFLKAVKNLLKQQRLLATGGGAFNYEKEIKEIIEPIEYQTNNEFYSIIQGTKYFVKHFPKFIYC